MLSQEIVSQDTANEALVIGASLQIDAVLALQAEFNRQAAREAARRAQVANMTGDVALRADNFFFVRQLG